MTLDFYSPAKQASTTKERELPPVHLWNPPFTDDIDIEIDRNGKWFHEGAEIKRQALIDLYSTIIKHEGGEYFLVTPTEKYRFKVKVAPLLITDWDCVNPNKQNQILRLKTQQGYWFELGEKHSIKLASLVAESIPIAHVRDTLFGVINRNIYYQLADLVEKGSSQDIVWTNQIKQDNKNTDIAIEPNTLGLRSKGYFFPLE